MERLGWLGTGLGNLMGSMGQQYQFTQQPNPSPLATALGIGATGAGIYNKIKEFN
jgi:phage tail tape-measure protein